jgi:hypothetical protein
MGGGEQLSCWKFRHGIYGVRHYMGDVTAEATDVVLRLPSLCRRGYACYGCGGTNV